MSKILAFSGSARQGSYNQKLVTIAAKGAEQAGAQVTVVNLGDFPMPLFNADEEADSGLPETVKAMKKLFVEHDGFLIASPEYNSCFSPLLKNTLDWCSRKDNADEAPLVAFKGKAACIMATSPGALGGLRGLVFLRMLLANLGILVLPQQLAVAKAAQAFDDNGELTDQQQHASVLQLGENLSHMLGTMKHGKA